MKKTFLAALVAALCTVPALARAETSIATHELTAATAPYFLARPAHSGAGASSDDTREYAAREKASPLLASFSGGDNNGIYIGTGALVVALAIVLLLVLL